MKNTCDPGSETRNVVELVKASGQVGVRLRWTWDGASTFPACAGTMTDLRVWNRTTSPWVLSCPNRSGTVKEFTIQPGDDRTRSRVASRALGFDTIACLDNISLRPGT